MSGQVVHQADLFLKKTVLCLVLVSTCLALSACRYINNIIPPFYSSKINSNADSDQVMMADHVELTLLSPESFGRSLAITQKITFKQSSNGQSADNHSVDNKSGIQSKSQKSENQASKESKIRTLLSQVEITPLAMRIAILTPAGIDIARIEWNGHETKISSRLKNLPFNVTYLIADMQLALWPTKMLNKALSGAKMQIEHTHHASKFSTDEVRKITHINDSPILTITRHSTGTAQQASPRSTDIPHAVHLKHHERSYDITINTLVVQDL